MKKMITHKCVKKVLRHVNRLFLKYFGFSIHIRFTVRKHMPEEGIKYITISPMGLAMDANTYYENGEFRSMSVGNVINDVWMYEI